MVWPGAAALRSAMEGTTGAEACAAGERRVRECAARRARGGARRERD